MPAPLFAANAHRHDPYRTFKFQVLIDGKPFAGLKKMSALKKTTEAVDWGTGGDPTHVRKLPGGTKYESITLEQWVSHDLVTGMNRKQTVWRIWFLAGRKPLRFLKEPALVMPMLPPNNRLPLHQLMNHRSPLLP